MRTLLLIRHAKSEQFGHFASDFERPLNERGLRDAPDMAKRLMERAIPVDVLVSSPAARAIKTCRLFAAQFGMKESEILEVPALYHAGADTMMEVVASIPDTFASAAVFTHNPGITELANRMVHGLHIDNMPTCAILAVESDAEQWKDFPSSSKRFLFFDYPKRRD